MKTYKMNVVNINGTSCPECTNCGHRFETDYAENPYREMCRIAKGKYHYCPKCGAEYIGCQIDGIDFEKCDFNKRDWLYGGL